MGVDFTAVVDHRFGEAELLALPDRLNAHWELPDSLRAWVEKHVGSGSTQWKWEQRLPQAAFTWEYLEDGAVWLDGPHGFHARAYRHAFRVMHLARWWSFLYESDVRLGLEESCRRIARDVGAEHILYLPDSSAPPATATDLLNEGGTVGDVQRWLYSTVGPPLQDSTALRGPDADDPYGSAWFYDRRGVHGWDKPL
jgi:hypothetical protein